MLLNRMYHIEEFRTADSEVCTAVAVIVAGDGDCAGPAELGRPELPGAAEQDVPGRGVGVEDSEVRATVAV